MGPCGKGGLRVVNIDSKLKALLVMHAKHLVDSLAQKSQKSAYWKIV